MVKLEILQLTCMFRIHKLQRDFNKIMSAGTTSLYLSQLQSCKDELYAIHQMQQLWTHIRAKQ